jgi:hypothetical protein
MLQVLLADGKLGAQTAQTLLKAHKKVVDRKRSP